MFPGRDSHNPLVFKHTGFALNDLITVHSPPPLDERCSRTLRSAHGECSSKEARFLLVEAPALARLTPVILHILLPPLAYFHSTLASFPP